MNENRMFCFQCQETSKGTGCTVKGVCGKLPETSRWQDLLLSVVRGVGTIQHSLDISGYECDKEVELFIVDALFATITNANFDDSAILQKVDNGIAIKRSLIAKAADAGVSLPDWQEVRWGGEKNDYLTEGDRESVLRNTDADLRSLKE
ncbi:MAG: hydroxylamine reductase, partial [Prevotella sp.]|nr:hydroxylamine reductase [Prevotella sp.]